MNTVAIPGTTRLVVTPRWEGERLDLFLAGETSLSRRGARQLAADGLVERNGDTLRVLSRTLRTGDVVDVLRAHEDDFAHVSWDLGFDFAAAPGATRVAIEKLAIHGVV